MLLMPDVPAKFQSKQADTLLHNSEHIFPPLNGICSLANLAVLIGCFVNRKSNQAAAEKLPFIGAAFGVGISVTVYTLSIMAPINASLRDSDRKLQAASASEKEEKEFRERGKKWQRLNYSESTTMG